MSIREEVLQKEFDELAPYQQRVVVELEELVAKFDKLSVFLDSDEFVVNNDEMGKFLLRQQLLVMSAYIHVLGVRAGRF